MDVGLYVNTQWPRGATVAVNEVSAQTRAARDAGFDSIWLPHHYLAAPVQMFQPMTLLGYLVRESGDMKLGINILLLPLLNPTLVAEEWATLDVLSEGRAVLGVGLGSRPEEYEAFNVPFKQRVSRMTEGVELLRRLWSEERVTFTGKHFRVSDAGISLRPVQEGGPPIFVAATVAGSIERAARIGDGWLIGSQDNLATLVEQVDGYRTALRQHGRPPQTPAKLTRECYVGSSVNTALEECRPALEAKYEAYVSWGSAHDYQSKASLSFEDFARDRFLIGDESSVKEDVARLAETLSIDQFLMRTQWLGLPLEASVRTVEALGRIFA
ncbi:LLM class flavin-dependent oxidoreductase [Mycobacterium colombiense]|uniref:LLM class flavin-dependent oxidoreductase n=1 Tax=Mycobacterium colombiense TaxID=339268 RepID=UPI00200A0659|nr:LLM class flavin-dependent oxidoreductase [Mycobacterium colombiense]MCK8647113.1 LLM class flavin-dependent oxidoreductase [Mycobacterium colombiense]